MLITPSSLKGSILRYSFWDSSAAILQDRITEVIDRFSMVCQIHSGSNEMTHCYLKDLNETVTLWL